MKNIFKYTMFALAGLLFAACNEDYKDWASPMSYAQEDAVNVPGFTATAGSAIDLNTAADTVSVFTLSYAGLPEGATVANVRMEVTPSDATADPVTLNALYRIF